MDEIKNIIMFMIIIYAVVISVLYWSYYINKEKYEEDLKKRESIVVDKEICFRELTKMKTIQSSILEILKSNDIQTQDTQKNLSQETEKS